MDNFLVDKWIEIDVLAIKRNLHAIQTYLDERVRLIAVLKANGYGQGAVEMARILYQNGVDFFAVTFLEEALAIRQAGIRASIMLFSPIISENQLKCAIENRITLTINSSYDGELINDMSRKLKTPVNVHLKVDTGLGRFGIDEDELLELCTLIRDNPYIYLEGLYTHMAQASDEKYTHQQFAKFQEIISSLEANNIHIPVKHCANSAVFLKYPFMHLNAVRIGTLLAGHFPVGKLPHPFALTDPLAFKTKIIAVHTLPAASFLGYFKTYRLKQAAKIAVIPVGFNDGLMLEVANPPINFVDLLKILARQCLRFFNIARFNTRVKIKGHFYPIRGKVFMQMALIELPLHSDVGIGDIVEVPMRKTLITGNLNYVFVKDGIPGKVRQDDKTVYVGCEE